MFRKDQIEPSDSQSNFSISLLFDSMEGNREIRVIRDWKRVFSRIRGKIV